MGSNKKDKGPYSDSALMFKSIISIFMVVSVIAVFILMTVFSNFGWRIEKIHEDEKDVLYKEIESVHTTFLSTPVTVQVNGTKYTKTLEEVLTYASTCDLSTEACQELVIPKEIITIPAEKAKDTLDYIDLHHYDLFMPGSFVYEHQIKTYNWDCYWLYDDILELLDEKYGDLEASEYQSLHSDLEDSIEDVKIGKLEVEEAFYIGKQ